MRRSHVCLGCGHDMCDINAPLDPHYHLPVVQCPKCNTAAVRRPARAPWKRTARSIWWMALQMVMLTLVFFMFLSIVGNLDLRTARFEMTYDPLVTIALVAIIIALIVSGAWLGATLRHIPLWALLTGLGCVLLVLVLLTSINQPWNRWPRLAWREMRLHGEIAGIVWLLASIVACISRAISGNMNERAIAKRLRKRRKAIERIMHT